MHFDEPYNTLWGVAIYKHGRWDVVKSEYETRGQAEDHITELRSLEPGVRIRRVHIQLMEEDDQS